MKKLKKLTLLGYLFAQHNSRTFTTSTVDTSSVPVLEPGWVTGFCDGESYFIVGLSKIQRLSTGWQVRPIFGIELHKKDVILLKKIQDFFGVGKVGVRKTRAIAYYIVTSVKDLKKIINHFDKYPLITQKKEDYRLFKRIVELMENKEHITPDGLQKIVNLRASMNLGLSAVLKAAFPNTIPAPRPKVDKHTIKDPQWISGFTAAEGCFFVLISESKTKIGFQVKLIFTITQHTRDSFLLKSLISWFGSGRYRQSPGYSHGEFIVEKFSDLVEIIIPFFEKYPPQGTKRLNFEDFYKIAELMKAKAHLTEDGLNQIKAIKAGMNTKRCD